MIDRFAIVVACFVTAALLVFVLEGQYEMRLQVDELRGRLTKAELELIRADEVGGRALRQHAQTAISQAHPESSSITCPTCPPCR